MLFMVLQRNVRSDEQLEWLRALLDRHEGALLRYARRLTGDAETARDVVQDTFLRLVAQERERQLELEGREAEWLFTVCRNRALDVRRKEGRMQRRDEGSLATETSREPAPAEAAEGKETGSKLMHLVSKLPDDQREVVLLKFQNGYSYKEIARITKHSVSNVGYLLHVAMKTLRKRMARPGLAQA